jgi:V8-like Glu-specific endopeptidase
MTLTPDLPMRGLLFFMAVLLAHTLPAGAQDPAVQPMRALSTADAMRGWEAVGRLDTGGGFCTATLIAPDLVLTAAHCLFYPDGTRRPDAALMFSAGLRNGQMAAQRTIRQSIPHPDYINETSNEMRQVQSDIALLRLVRAIPVQTVRPLDAEGGFAGVGDRVSVVSYGEAREGYASLEEGCAVLAENPGVLILSCTVAHGSSGAPVLMTGPDGAVSVVAVMSAMAEWRAEPVALSAEVDGKLPVLLDLMARDAGPSTHTLPQVRSLGGPRDGRDSIGARFIRP